MLVPNGKAESYKKLILCVTGGDAEDLLPLREEDVSKINVALEQLGSGASSGRSHAEVLSMNFGLNGDKPMSYAKIGRKFGVTGGAVRNQIMQSLNRLRHSSRKWIFLLFLRSHLEKRIDELEKENAQLKTFKAKVKLAVDEKAIETGPDSDLAGRSVKSLHFSVRTNVCLLRADIKTIGDLIRKTDAELLRMKNLGRKSLNEIRSALADLGLQLGMML